jgi:hypothetical protein
MSAIRIFLLWVQWVFLLRPSVVLIDHDGECNARLARGIRHYRWSKRMGLGVSSVRLHSDGTTTGAVYVTRWEPLFPSDFTIPKAPGAA